MSKDFARHMALLIIIFIACILYMEFIDLVLGL